MKNKYLSLLWRSVGLVALLLFFIPQAFAIGIQPARQEAQAKPGESFEVTVKISNETDKDFYAEPVLKTFYRNDENGFPIFEKEEAGNVDPREWLDISQEPVLVKAKDSVPVTFKVKVPKDVEPGGKYVIIGYKPIKKSEGSIVVNVVANSYLLINVEGEVKKSGELLDFSIPKENSSQDAFSFNINFKNTGNTHLKPTGAIEIEDVKTNEPLKKIATYIDPNTGSEVTSDYLPVNLDKNNVLPQSNRIYTVKWTENLKPGHYRAKLKLNFDGDTPPLQKELEFKLNEKLDLKNFDLKETEKETNFLLTFFNSGEGAQKLMGMVTIKNNFGHVVDEIELPKDWEPISQGESKKYTLKWLETKLPEGSYQADLNVDYGFTKQKIEATIKFGTNDYSKIVLVFLLGMAVLLLAYLLIRKRK